ncbi:MAG: YajQ family cyclic di-GMP-binding protein [Pseudomonadales bacterium]|nr:YajQ family cyclic di-GMP-binding protein [Pseudomonadales bacterium]HNB82852.1 YajQ family cyclic di-GMP-binding protein [Pseudomonadales bacterium]HNH69929.1 YajQ family cyclic di-GMP-binding protein [Pseudomonadales bacterium]
MPTFDVISEVDLHEATNAIDQANRELGTRYDFRGVQARFSQKEHLIDLEAESEFQLEQMLEMLRTKLAGRKIDIRCLEVKEPEKSGKQIKQQVTLRQGIDKDLARELVKQIKESKLKVQAAIIGDKVRVTGKKRDDLQQAIALLRAAEFELPLQFDNFRD